VKSDQLGLVTLDGRYVGELLAQPCECGRPQCTIGAHIWRATYDMRPGPKAQNLDSRVRGQGTDTNEADPEPDPALHLEYLRLVMSYWRDARALADFIGRLRPDRVLRNPPVLSTVQDWCENHLATIGVCEPRYRGDLCEWCYRVQLAHGALPDQQFLRERRDRGRVTPLAETAFLERIRATRPKSKARKSRKAG
jgi:hypothetical protein